MESDSDEDLELVPYDPFEEDESPFDYQDSLLNSPILKAVLDKDTKMVEKLILEGKSLNVIDNNGNTALHHAVLKNDLEMVDLLLKFEFNVDLQNFLGYTPLLLGIKDHSDEDIIDRLLKYGCNVNIKNSKEDSALHYAVTGNTSTRIIQQLIEHGADIDAQDGSLFTPLHQAVYSSNMNAMCLLLYYNADPSILCHDNMTPFMYSISKPHDFSKILYYYYDDFSTVSTRGHTALQLAQIAENPIIVNIIRAGLNTGFSHKDALIAVYYTVLSKNFALFKSTINTFLTSGLTLLQFDLFLSAVFLLLNDENFFDYFYILIECATQGFLCDNSMNYRSNSLNSLFDSLDSDETPKYIIEIILWSILSLGITVTTSDISDCFDCLKNGPEVEILFSVCSHFAEDHCCYRSIPLHYFKLLMQSKNPTYLKSDLMNFTIKAIIKHSEDYPDIVDYLYYMSFIPSIIDAFQVRDIGINIWPKLDTPSFPSLQELSRNACAVHIVKKFKIKRPSQFFYVVNHANIPKVIKDLLLFKKPVH